MKKTNFLKLLELMSNMDRDIIVLEGLGIDLQDSSITKGLYEIFSIAMEESYDREGLDWILWFIYEKQSNPALKAFDSEGNEIIKTEDELYEYLNVNHKLR